MPASSSLSIFVYSLSASSCCGVGFGLSVSIDATELGFVDFLPDKDLGSLTGGGVSELLLSLAGLGGEGERLKRGRCKVWPCWRRLR
jgi:hypothetical protein